MTWYGGTPLGTLQANPELCRGLIEASSFPDSISMRAISPSTIPAVASWRIIETITGERYTAPGTAANATAISGLSGLGIPHGSYRFLPLDGSDVPIDGLGGRLLFMPIPSRVPSPSPDGELLQFLLATAFGISRFRSGDPLHWDYANADPQLIIDLTAAQDPLMNWHPSRSRKLVATIAEGVHPADSARIAQVTDWAEQYPDIEYWVIGNEPGIDQPQIPVGTDLIPQARAAALAVWAGNPNAKVLAPNHVHPYGNQASQIRQEIGAGLFDVVPGSSGKRMLPATHLYNWTDLPSLRIQLDSLQGLFGPLDGGAISDVWGSMWCDEWSTPGAMVHGAGNAGKQLQQFMFASAALEQRGWLVDRLATFEGYIPNHPGLVHSLRNQPFPILGAMRRMSEHVIQSGAPTVLGTGTPFDDHVVMSTYERDDESSVLLVSDGAVTSTGPLTQKFAVSGGSPTSLQVENYIGRALTPASVVGQEVTLEIPVGAPNYVTLPDGVSIEPIAEVWTPKNYGAKARFREWNGSSYVITSSGSAGAPARLPLDSYRNGRLVDVPNGSYGDRTTLMSNVTPSVSHPVYYEIELSSLRWINALPIRSLIPHQDDQSAILEATVEYSEDGTTWLPLEKDGDPITISHTPDVIVAPATMDEGDGGYFEWLQTMPFAWVERFDRTWVKWVRLVITKCTAAGAPDVDAVTTYGLGGVTPGTTTPKVALARVELFDVADGPTTSVSGYLVSAP